MTENGPENLSETLLLACHEGDHERVRQLLSNPAININQSFLPPGSSALFTACFEGHLQVVKLLLTHPLIAVNQPQNEGASPFFAACQEGHLEVVRLLLADDRVDVNQAMIGNVTPLFMACQGGFLDIVTLLLSDGRVDRTKPTDDGGSPLFISCQEGYAEIVKLLLADEEVVKRANQNIVDGQSILSVVCEKNQVEVLKLLMVCEMNEGLLAFDSTINKEKAMDMSTDELWLALLEEIDKEEIYPRDLAEAQGFLEILELMDDFQRDHVAVRERLRVELGIAGMMKIPPFLFLPQPMLTFLSFFLLFLLAFPSSFLSFLLFYHLHIFLSSYLLSAPIVRYAGELFATIIFLCDGQLALSEN